MSLKEKILKNKAKRLEQMGITDYEVCEGLLIHSKPFIKTLRKMEVYFNLSSVNFNQLDFTRINTLMMLVYFLARQRWEYMLNQGMHEDPEITEDYIEDVFEYISSQPDGLDSILHAVLKMLGVDIDIRESTDNSSGVDGTNSDEKKTVSET